VFLLALIAAGVIAIFLGNLIATISSALVLAWVCFAGAIFYLFRDPDPVTPGGMPKAVVAPSHGRVEGVDEALEPDVLRGDCRRISISLSWLDIHALTLPADGVITRCVEECAAGAPSGAGNAVLMGVAPREAPRDLLAVRGIAGRYPRRVQCWVRTGDLVERGSRAGLLQFGSRCELYVPLSAEVTVKPGDRLRGGETIVACLA
jgi:phosphatidylserine decarboxylase